MEGFIVCLVVYCFTLVETRSNRPYHFKFRQKGCLSQILVGPFLNILTHFTLRFCD